MSDAPSLRYVANATTAIGTELRAIGACLFLYDAGQPATPAQVAALDALRQAVKMMEDCA